MPTCVSIKGFINEPITSRTVDFKDYYKVMGLERDASEADVKRAYRKLARKFHPDVSKEADAETRFKELGEAYAVLKDPEKRAAYDQLGANWKSGQEFKPPPDWATGFEFDGRGFDTADAAGYSDFFETLFGQQFGGTRQHARSGRSFSARGNDHHAKVLVDLEDAYNGATRTLSLRTPDYDENGRVVSRERSLKVRIPKGVTHGQRIRLQGQGSPGFGGGAAGDLFLEIDIRPHSLYSHNGRDISLSLPVTPWEAALGATIKVPTPDGPVDLKLPAGTKNGKRLRLKGKGIPGSPPGDFYVTAELTLPPADSDLAKATYKKMQQEMNYNPRKHLEA